MREPAYSSVRRASMVVPSAVFSLFPMGTNHKQSLPSPTLL